MTVKERLRAFIEYLKLTNQKFELECGLSNGYIANIRKGVGEDALERISNKYPQLSKSWLLTGEGEMLKKSSPTGDISNSTIVGGNVNGNGNKITHYGSEYDACQKEVEHLKAIIDEKDKIIAEKEQRLIEKNSLISEKERMIKLLLKEKE